MYVSNDKKGINIITSKCMQGNSLQQLLSEMLGQIKYELKFENFMCR